MKEEYDFTNAEQGKFYRVMPLNNIAVWHITHRRHKKENDSLPREA